MKLEISHIPEFELDPAAAAEMQGLLALCFPGFLDRRIYYKQRPHSRLVGRLNGDLVAQVGLDFRTIRIGSEVVNIVGIIDLCVAPGHRSCRYAEALLDRAEAIGRERGLDLAVLLADDHRLYSMCGFELVQRECVFLGIHEHQSIGLIRRELNDCLMVKALGNGSVPDGEVDFLGYLF
ncbi:MAG: GNAT family N-acetyltransferase [Myxococcales bacterium]|nr:GNAT family N-acetyltransferase [Myxococcales bacterium]